MNTVAETVFQASHMKKYYGATHANDDVSITLPRELADDERSFSVVRNDDGTISIIIGQVQEIRTE